MAIVSAEVRFAPQLTAWFTANPTKVLQDGEIVYCSDGANVGKYVIGDNSTQLSALTFYGGISSSGLTIGTTTITSGTNTRILYNNAGVVGEYLVTGTGTTAVLSTSPTFTTGITTPLIIGGTGVGSVIQYKGTSGNGTSTVAAHQFLVGNNGATTAMGVYNSGNVNIGNYASPALQRLVTIGQDASYMSLGSWTNVTSYSAIYMGVSTPGNTNHVLISNSSNTQLNSTSTIQLAISAAVQLTVSSLLLNYGEGVNKSFGTTTGTKLGTATTQKLSFWNATPIVQPTTAVAASTLTSNGGTTLTSTDTIDGYTLLQVVKALRNTGLLQ